MDWRRFKNIIIIALVIINTVFGVFLIKVKLSDKSSAIKTRENVILVLKNAGISLQKEDFPESRSEYSACYISRFLPGDASFINKIIGNNGSFSEENEVLSFKLSPSGRLSLEREDITEVCRAFMDKNGIFSELYSEEYIKISDKSAKARFCLEYDGCKFFDSYIEFSLNSKGICAVKGKNFVKIEEDISRYEATNLPLESILVSIPRDKEKSGECRISDISFGYYLGNSADVYVSVLALPVWEIKFSDGETLFYDARNGNLIEF